MTFIPWLRRHPLLGYFALAYGINWGGICVAIGANGFDQTVMRAVDTGPIFVSMLRGANIAGLTMTALLDGRAGLRELRSRLMPWRVGFRWYALALLTMPVLMLAVLLPFSLFADPAFAPRYLATLTAYRVLMTWMFAHTCSLLLAVLVHATYTDWLLALLPVKSFEHGLAWQATLAPALRLAVAVIGVFRHPGRTGVFGGHRRG
ncbi:MAG: hypothetical protein LH632_20850 [Rhodoferax sp.]|nr:hypothetical protein [Rhodoferax sp.]